MLNAGPSILGPFKTTHNQQNIIPTVCGVCCYLLSQRLKELRLTTITSFFLNRRSRCMVFALFLWCATNRMHVFVFLWICVYVYTLYAAIFRISTDILSLYNLQQKRAISWLMPSSISVESIVIA